MFGIFLTIVYAIYAHFVLGSSLGHIHLVATNFLFYWFAVCGVASTLWLIFVIVCAILGVSLFNAQAVASRKLISYGIWLSALSFVSNVAKYAILLFGTYLLHNSYYEGHLNRLEFAIGFILVLIGISTKATIARKRKIRLVTK